MDTVWLNELRRQASLHHMCEENRTSLGKVSSKEEAVALYKKTIDWALEEGYPNIDTLRRHFSDCEDLGIFIDKDFHGEVLKDHQVYVFHNCRGLILTGLNVEKQIIPMLYFANGCDMTVKSSGSDSVESRVPLYIFGKNGVYGVNSEDVVFVKYKFDTK